MLTSQVIYLRLDLRSLLVAHGEAEDALWSLHDRALGLVEAADPHLLVLRRLVFALDLLFRRLHPPAKVSQPSVDIFFARSLEKKAR